ncbi:MAG: 4-hydroxythreonine-4-phosphate dehydrogenase PdxA [Pseudomonadota bacterium]|nr:4-hydroxythreonine-4-phosphate dehydrogenase PdxA [Pseudomonadota bacterium]
MTDSRPLRIAITPGEPAGIGQDLLLLIAQENRDFELVAIVDPVQLRKRSKALGLEVKIIEYSKKIAPKSGKAKTLIVENIPSAVGVKPGHPNPLNGDYLLNSLKRAAEGCLKNEFSALVTGPVEKSIINQSGNVFSGHTEFLAEICNVPQPVMLLCSNKMRVALLTTHLALREVPSNITKKRIKSVVKILNSGLEELFGIDKPRISVLGLNPHAGEKGELGSEEIRIIKPAIQNLSKEGLNVFGPIVADSAFTEKSLEKCDAVLAMYHDQGLPVLKHSSFGEAVNITLGLPFIRTSVDHGTALDISGKGDANPNSLKMAIKIACDLAGPK